MTACYHIGRGKASCLQDSHELVRSYLRTHSHALVVFDRHGSGTEKKSSEAIESDVENRLASNGWTKDNCACVVLNPELEIRVWAKSDEVARMFGFGPDVAAMTAFLSEKNF